MLLVVPFPSLQVLFQIARCSFGQYPVSRMALERQACSFLRLQTFEVLGNCTVDGLQVIAHLFETRPEEDFQTSFYPGGEKGLLRG